MCLFSPTDGGYAKTTYVVRVGPETDGREEVLQLEGDPLLPLFRHEGSLPRLGGVFHVRIIVLFDVHRLISFNILGWGNYLYRDRNDRGFLLQDDNLVPGSDDLEGGGADGRLSERRKTGRPLGGTSCGRGTDGSTGLDY